MTKKYEPSIPHKPYCWMNEHELREMIRLLEAECIRLRRELDEAKGVVR